MYFLLFLILLIAMIGVAMFETSAAITMQLDTDREDFHASFFWLYPLFSSKITMMNYSPLMTFYIFKKRVYSKTIKKKPKQTNRMDYLQAAVLSDKYANFSYGLEDPFVTGFASGILQMLQAVFGGVSIQQMPDFLSQQDYIRISAGAKLNIGKTLVQFIRMWKENKMKRSGHYGSIQYS